MGLDFLWGAAFLGRQPPSSGSFPELRDSQDLTPVQVEEQERAVRTSLTKDSDGFSSPLLWIVTQVWGREVSHCRRCLGVSCWVPDPVLPPGFCET